MEVEKSEERCKPQNPGDLSESAAKLRRELKVPEIGKCSAGELSTPDSWDGVLPLEAAMDGASLLKSSHVNYPDSDSCNMPFPFC